MTAISLHMQNRESDAVQDDVKEKENVAPVNNFHKALLEVKDQVEDIANEAGADHKSVRDIPEAEVHRLDAFLDKVTKVEENTVIPHVLEADEDMELFSAPHTKSNETGLVQIKELSVIAEDDEDRSRNSPQPLVLNNDAAMDVTVPLCGAAAVSTVPTLTRKPSMSQFTGLSAPSPLRKSMKLSREPSSGILAPTLAHTPGTSLGGKRTSWLTKAKEVRALEMTSGSGKKLDSVEEAGLRFGIMGTNKKRKSGDMLGQGDNNTEDDLERKQKSAKFLQAVQAPIPIAQTTSNLQPEAMSIKVSASAPKTLSVQDSGSSPFMDDYTVPLADISEDEGAALDKLKRTVEGFGARSKSMGKSLGGTAVVALAEARAAAEARVAERNKEAAAEEEEGSLSQPMTTTDVIEPEAVASGPERRLSVSELVSSAERKAKGSNVAADTSVSTTPPDSPRQPTRLSQAAPAAPPPVFSKPPPVFVAPPPAAPMATVKPAAKDVSFKLPVGHPFAIPPAMALGVNFVLAPSGLSKGQPVSAQSSKASIFSDAVFDKEDDIPAWMPTTQDTESSLNHTEYTQDGQNDVLYDDDSWHVDDKLKSNQVWTPFGFTTQDKDDTMTWTTATSRSTSQKGGDTDRFQTGQDTTEALQPAEESRSRDPFDFLPKDSACEVHAETDMADMSMDIDDDESPQLDSELEDIAFAGRSTISLVQVRVYFISALRCLNLAYSLRRILEAKVNNPWRPLLHLSPNSLDSSDRQAN